MRRDQVDLGAATLIAYGHWGRPVLVFPSEQGRAWDFENNGMVDAVADLIDAGRVKLYCVDSADGYTWSDRPCRSRSEPAGTASTSPGSAARSSPWIAGDCGGAADIATLGCSLGAYHAVNFALKHAHVFPLAMGFSGNYDPTTWHAWGEQGDATYFNNPMAYVANLDGGHLDWLRERVSLLLVVGQGAWEVSTRPVRCRAPERSRICWHARGFGTNSTSGGTTFRTTGRRGARSCSTTCRGSARRTAC